MLTKKLKTKTLNIRLKINSSLTAIQLSDFHFKEEGRLEKDVKNYLETNSYDLLFLTGDYLSTPDKLNNFFKYIDSIDFKAQVIAVPGNHDYNQKINKFADKFKASNIIFLENDNYIYKQTNQKINIIGIGSPDIGQDNFDKAVAGIDLNEGYNIILSHTYDIVYKIDLKQIDLILAGDTHGGQINIPFITKWLMKRIFGTRYLAGRYDLGNTVLYINQGIGTSGLPFRINCQPELTEIKLIPK